MKGDVSTFLKRAGAVTGGLLFLMTAARCVGLLSYMQEGLVLIVVGWVGFVWACNSVMRNIARVSAVPLAGLMALTLGFVNLVGSTRIANAIIEYRYRAHGYEMETGCNLAAAMGAEMHLYELSNRIDEARLDSPTNTNELKQLQEELETTRKRVEFLDADIRKRGHRGTAPVRTSATNSFQPTSAARGDAHDN